MTLEVGSIVGGREIAGEVARGGFGVVYRAIERTTGAQVAIKVLHAELAQDLEIVRRFEREIRVVQLIHHANIVKILDVGSLETGEPFFVMELLVGKTLKAQIADVGRLSAAEALEVLEPLCSALATGHAKGVIHRDLKASNVFLGDRVVLLDYGIAKLVEETGSKITSSRHVVGTPMAMAPEQILGAELGPRTDVYGLGVLAFLMLTAEAPFVSKSAVILQEMQLSSAAPAPSTKAPLPRELDEVLLRALAKDPDQRQAGPLEFLDEFRAAISGTAAQRADPNELVTALFIEHRADIDMELASESVLDAIDNVLPTLLSSLPDSIAPQSSSGNSTLLFSLDRTPEDLIESVRSILRSIDCPHLSFFVFAKRGPRRDFDSSSEWLPEFDQPGFFVL